MSSTPISINLVFSLIFGVGQLVVGSFVARNRLRAWREIKSYIILLVGAWFIGSGLAELLVSGMEVARDVTGTPSLATFNRWHAGADTFLLVWTLALVLALALWPLARQVWPAKARVGSGASTPSDSPAAH